MLYITFQALRAFLKPKYNLAHPPSTSNMDLLLLTLDSPPPTRFYLCLITYSVYSTLSACFSHFKRQNKIKLFHGPLCVFLPSLTSERIGFSNGSQSVVCGLQGDGSSKPFDGVCQVKITFIILLRHNCLLHFIGIFTGSLKAVLVKTALP